MKSEKTLALLGGDLRHDTAARYLCRWGYTLKLWGQGHRNGASDGIEHCRTWEEAVADADAVVLPLPSASDGFLLNCPFAEAGASVPSLKKLFSGLPQNCTVIGGKIPETVRREAVCDGLRVYDYCESEPFQIHNAYTTAEAALSVAMNRLDKNIRESRVAITGFGRIAKHLVKLLRALDAEVTVAARKEEDVAWAACTGCRTLQIGSDAPSRLSELCCGYDIIYNTVPCWLFDRAFLERMDTGTFLIDLASAPGGVDVGAAKELGANVLWATSLPGKYAPHSAGRLIAECTERILREEVPSP